MPDTPFRTPDEWRRAREAWIHMALLDDRTLAVTGSRPGLEAEWAREFPCPPEPDRAEDERVLDAYLDLVRWLRAWALARDNTRPSEEEVNAARAAVLKRMQHPDTRPAPAEVEAAVEEFEEAVFTADVDNPNSEWVTAAARALLAARKEDEV